MKYSQPGFRICIDSYVRGTYVSLFYLNRFVFDDHCRLDLLVSSECEMIGCTQSFRLVTLEGERHGRDKGGYGRRPDAVTHALNLFMRKLAQAWLSASDPGRT